MLFVYDNERNDIANILCDVFKPQFKAVNAWYGSMKDITVDFISDDYFWEFAITSHGLIYDINNQHGCGLASTIQELIDIISKRLEEIGA